MAFAGDVGGRDAHPGFVRGVAGQEVLQDRPALAVEDFDFRRVPDARACDNIGSTVAVRIAGRHPDAAVEGLSVRAEVADRARDLQPGGAVKDPDFGRGARPGAGDYVEVLGAGPVAGGDGYSCLVAGAVAVEGL